MIRDIAGFAYDCKDADALSDFYVKLLGWEKIFSGNGWAGLHSLQGWIFAFQEIEEYVAPVWPRQKDKQQMAQIDFLVDDLEKGVLHALECGARKSEIQYYNKILYLF